MSKMRQIYLLFWIMGITTVNTLKNRPDWPTELNTMNLVITAYQSLGNVHIDGQSTHLLTNAKNWSLTDYVALSSLSRLIALEGMISNSEPCAGVLASVNDTYLLTNSSWRCVTYSALNWTGLGFDDSSWPSAAEYGTNGNHATCGQQRHFDDINSNAKWIWSSDTNAMAVYCRGYLPLCQTSSPCLNGGTCLPNHKKICDCPPEYTGTYCESLLMDGSLVITAYKTLVNMYIDGIEQPLINGSRWDYTDRAGLTETNRLVAVKATGDGTCGGILASFGDAYVLTNAEWRCSPYNFGNWYGLGFNDTQKDWFSAAEFGSNADGHTHCSHLQVIPDISLNAMWIWIADQTDGGSVFCRGYMPVCDSSPCLNNGTCLQNDLKMCDCQPLFTGTYCETALCQTSSPCLNGGTCLPNHKKMCDCPPEYTGTYCESPVCDSTPCQNNGTCLQNNANMCRCLPQFTGTYCETGVELYQNDGDRNFDANDVIIGVIIFCVVIVLLVVISIIIAARNRSTLLQISNRQTQSIADYQDPFPKPPPYDFSLPVSYAENPPLYAQNLTGCDDRL